MWLLHEMMWNSASGVCCSVYSMHGGNQAPFCLLAGPPWEQVLSGTR